MFSSPQAILCTTFPQQGQQEGCEQGVYTVQKGRENWVVYVWGKVEIRKAEGYTLAMQPSFIGYVEWLHHMTEEQPEHTKESKAKKSDIPL